ncbi:MAG: ATP-binding cassette domain-containing protein [Chthoniobacterales bacterium]
MNPPLLRCRDLHCRRPLWRAGASQVRQVNADFSAGLFHAICGPADCGNNLLLHLLGLLEQPDSGEVWCEDVNATQLDQSARDTLRQRTFGFLFPANALLPSLSVLENIAFPLLKSGAQTQSEQTGQTIFALEFCGLEDEAESPVSALPPEKQALVCFARAIIHRPRALLAESPAAEEILVPLARRAMGELGLTVVWSARPDGPAAQTADHVLAMSDGFLTVPAT